MNAIDICPSTLEPGYNSYSPRAVRNLFDGAKVCPYLEFNLDEFHSPVDISDAMRRISVSGVQEKFPAVIDDGHIRIARDNERSTHILKPAPWDRTLRDRNYMPANEHLTMQIASTVYGIKTAANGLCFTKDGHPVYITRRFDILPDGSKMTMEDIASLIEINEHTSGRNFKYNGTYEDIAVTIRRNVAAWMVDTEAFFTILIFNYIYANGDAHLKNFSLIAHNADFRLSPAYDLINTSLHIDGDDLGLVDGLSHNIEKSDVYDRTGHLCRLDFKRFGTLIGLVDKRIDKILDMFTSLPDKAGTLINNSFLPPKLKRSYLRIVNERISRFMRFSQ